MDYFEGKPIGEKQELRVMLVSQRLSCRDSRLLIGDAMYISPQPVIDDSFLLKILLVRGL